MPTDNDREFRSYLRKMLNLWTALVLIALAEATLALALILLVVLR